MNIYSTEQLEKASLEQLEKIDKALVAAAYKIKDNAQSLFINNGKYKNLDRIKDGIMLGRLQNSSITLHAFGYDDAAKQTYKARFFVGGTQIRVNKKPIGNHKKPLTKGRIEPLDTIDKATQGGERILDNYIKQALRNG